MPSPLGEELKVILPGVLPPKPEESIRGPELSKKVRPLLKDDYPEASLRYQYSTLSKDLADLDSFPSADTILKMNDDDFDNLASKVSPKYLAVGKDRETMDWQHVNDLRTLSDDFVRLFKWTACCLEKKCPYSYTEWEQIAKIEKNYT